METEFKTFKDMIYYISGDKDKEEIRIRIETILRQMDKVGRISTEENKEKTMCTLIIALKYYLLEIQEYKRAYEFYREVLDKQYVNYLKENKELDEFFLFVTEVELICAIKIGTISEELKSMIMLIDIEAFSIPEVYNICDLTFYLHGEIIEAYGYFAIYLICLLYTSPSPRD